jgi:signal recognition particle receptor subunit beta
MFTALSLFLAIVFETRKIPFLFLANKKDLEQSATPSDISFGLGLEHIKDRNWYIW